MMHIAYSRIIVRMGRSETDDHGSITDSLSRPNLSRPMHRRRLLYVVT